jgi:sortase A
MHKAPPLSASEEIRSGWALDHSKTASDAPEPVAPNPPRPPRVPLAPLSPTRMTAVVTAATVSVLAVWFVLFALVFSGLKENHEQHVLYSHLRENLALATVPFGGTIKAGTPVALISAPTIKLHSVVVEGTASRQLVNGPGHYPASPMPGQGGRSVLLGRSATFGSPFANIASLHQGDAISVTTGQGVFTYVVDDVRRAGDPGPAVVLTGHSALTLVTSAGSGWRSGWAPTKVVYVDATLSGSKVVPTPPGQPTAAPAADGLLASDTSGLVPLVLWLQALVLLTAGLVYARTKWSLWQLWLVGLPVAVAVLWGSTSAALLLLPNLA